MRRSFLLPQKHRRPGEETTLQEITKDQLEAIQPSRVCELSDSLWMLGIDYTAANGVMDDLERYLVDSR